MGRRVDGKMEEWREGEGVIVNSKLIVFCLAIKKEKRRELSIQIKSIENHKSAEERQSNRPNQEDYKITNEKGSFLSSPSFLQKWTSNLFPLAPPSPNLSWQTHPKDKKRRRFHFSHQENLYNNKYHYIVYCTLNFSYYHNPCSLSMGGLTSSPLCPGVKTSGHSSLLGVLGLLSVEH
jgi:hypothetical protein